MNINSKLPNGATVSDQWSDYEAVAPAAEALRQHIRDIGLEPDSIRSVVQLGSADAGNKDDFAERFNVTTDDSIPYFGNGEGQGIRRYGLELMGGSSVEAGHKGRLDIGIAGSESHVVLGFRGRIAHLHEGATANQCVRPLRVAALTGPVKNAVISNACGILKADGESAETDTIQPGMTTVATGLMNLTGGYSALQGRPEQMWGKESFDSMREALPKWMIEEAKKIAKELNIPLPEVIYAQHIATRRYQFPAESKMIKGFGADLVGKSTVIEAEVLPGLGMKNAIVLPRPTNYAEGIRADWQPTITHEHVGEVGAQGNTEFTELVYRLLIAAENRENTTNI